MKYLAIAVAAAAVLGLASLPVATATSGTPARVATRTVAVASSRLRPGTRVMLPATYHHRRVVRFQWLRCNPRGARCRTIRGATHRAYVVRLADVGHTLRARIVTWQGSTTAVTAATPQVGRPLPVNTAAPTITDGGQGGGQLSGPFVGDVLSGTNGSWQHAVRFTYQWMDCDQAGAACVPIAGATGNSYALQDSDVGDTVVFQVTAYNF